MSEPYSEPQVIPEAVGGRLVLVIALELALLLGGTYGAWRFASSRGLGVKARPSPIRDDSGFAGKVAVPKAPAPGVEEPPTVAVSFETRAKFGMRRIRPREGKPLLLGRLTSSRRGSTNQTTVRIDGECREFGTGPGEWLANAQAGGFQAIPDRSWIYAWDYPNKIRVTQVVAILDNEDTKHTDTVLVRYLIENHDAERAHSVALRFLLDTQVGDTDGVPFMVPGQRALLKKSQEFKGDQVPCFLQALERSSIADPGTVATLTLRCADPLASGRAMLEPAHRVVIAGMPQAHDWEIEESEFLNQDSCVALYWGDQRLGPGEKRVLGFLYGQGKLFTSGAAELALSYGPKPFVGTDMDVVAWVKDPAVGQRATIELPDSMHLVQPTKATQPVTGGPGSLVPVSWRVRVDRKADAGVHVIGVRSGSERETLAIPVRQFDFEVIE